MKQLIISCFLFVWIFAFNCLADNQVLIEKISAGARTSGSDSLVLVQNGETLIENYSEGGNQRQNVQSITKSVAALAIAILIDDKKIESFDEPMSRWFPAWKEDPEKSKITLRMILSHTSGYPDVQAGDDFFKSADIVQRASETKLIASPGVRFLYSNIGTFLLQRVIADASGETVSSFLEKRLFHPLGIIDWGLSKDSKDHELLAGGLSLRPKDLLQLGVLLLNRGIYNKQRILNAETLDEMVQKSSDHVDFGKGYGLLFWLFKSDPEVTSYRMFLALGWGGQYLVIYPEKNLIALRTRNPWTVKKSQDWFYDFVVLVSQWE